MFVSHSSSLRAVLCNHSVKLWKVEFVVKPRLYNLPCGGSSACAFKIWLWELAGRLQLLNHEAALALVLGCPAIPSASWSSTCEKNKLFILHDCESLFGPVRNVETVQIRGIWCDQWGKMWTCQVWPV